MNQDPSQDFIPRDICSCFFTKAMTLGPGYRRPLFDESSLTDTAIFSCLRTMSEFGPDEEDALPDTCRPGRTCYAPEADIS